MVMTRRQEGRTKSQRDYVFGLLSADEPFATDARNSVRIIVRYVFPRRNVQHITNTDYSKLDAATVTLAPGGVRLFQFIIPKSLTNAVVVKTIFVEKGKNMSRNIFCYVTF
jgi:hypothetical protein